MNDIISRFKHHDYLPLGEEMQTLLADGPAPDGQKFLVSEAVSRDSPFIVIEHWQALLR